MTADFDFYGSYPFTQMLRDQIAGNNNSWAIRWYASAFLKNKLTLYPGRSLINNIGSDGSGTHRSKKDFNQINVENNKIELKKIELEEDTAARLAIANFFKSRTSLWNRLKKRLKKLIKK